jgi:sulfate transport system permease protein
MGLIVLIPIAALIWQSLAGGLDEFFKAITSPPALAAIQITFIASFVVVIINAVVGTLIAFVLVRDEFPGKSIVDGLIDLPFALPTIVAGLTLVTLYGPRSPFGINIAYTTPAIIVALLFLTPPLLLRSVPPGPTELDPGMAAPAASLGASGPVALWRIVLPSLAPAILTGAALAFARSLGEFGSVVLISGNIPDRTEVAAVYIYGQVEADRPTAAAAVSVFLLVASLAVLVSFDLIRRRLSRHEEPA